MYFEKRAFFYWLDDGVVEIALEMEGDLSGTWRTMDNDKSAIGKLLLINKYYYKTIIIYSN